MKRKHYLVPGKKCFPYVTDAWKKHPKRAKDRLWDFLLREGKGDPYCYGDDITLAKRALTQITGRGLGELEMFMVRDLIDEWWQGQSNYLKEDGQWIEKRQTKGERDRRTPRENLKKANKVKAAKAERKRELEKQRKREEKRQEDERRKRAWEKLVKPPPPRHYYD